MPACETKGIIRTAIIKIKMVDTKDLNTSNSIPFFYD
jgi:hypothetical protein